jgi:Putative Ig domain
MHGFITRGPLASSGSAGSTPAPAAPAAVRRASHSLSRVAVVIGTAAVLGGAGLIGSLALAGPASAQSTPACPAPVISGTTATVTCGYTGAAQYWTVPVAVSQATFTLYGAEGGTSVYSTAGGLGAEVTGTLPVTAGSTLQINVGQGGALNTGPTFGGGGQSGDDGTSGGGASDVRDGSYGLADRLLVAGGGGGGGAAGRLEQPDSDGGPGGNAGSPGQQGASGLGGCGETLTGGGGGLAGTSSAGGSGGAGGTASGTSCGVTAGSNGAAGSAGAGGAGGEAFGGAGGGGGYYGGGGSGGESGSDNDTDCSAAGGGGGGSSYTGTASNASVTDGVAASAGSPNGEVVITYTIPGPPSVISAGLPSGSVSHAYSAVLGADGGVPPYTWSLASGSLPAGLALDSSNGVIAGRPTAPGIFRFQVKVTDSDVPAESATKKLSITIRPTITKVTPDHGAQAGGTRVTLKGTGLTCPAAATSCTVTVHFGSHKAKLRHVASSGIVVSAPRGRGTVYVTVTVAGATSAKARADRFTYRR